MYVVIAGINTLSKRLVSSLESNHDVVVIDEDKDRCERLYSSSAATVINKKPSTLTALEDAGIDRADVLIAARKDDNENMVVSSLAKKYGVPKVVSRVEDNEYYDAFQVIGAETIGHTDLLISEFVSAVEHPYLVKIANLSNDREILKASVERNSGIEDMTVEEVESEKRFPSRFQIVSVLQGENTLSGESNVQLEREDEIILIGPQEKKSELDEFFKRQ
ncbi:potassium channel family protein [Candidatus Nanohalococcus occultus]|uniref:TrkA, K transport system, NAD-binding component n=1 Tax=Candidatus Nanohalococcus occultus TaxID=2978047 RepID=A0ABY8CJP9_9ARCH|nr:TrkA, K transport system, NAD-binding component [Candidatus Nanohaloarchaeota archaeon SVXNc]